MIIPNVMIVRQQGFDERESSIKDRNNRQRASKGEGRNGGGGGGHRKKARTGGGALPAKPRSKKDPAGNSGGKKRSRPLATG